MLASTSLLNSYISCHSSLDPDFHYQNPKPPHSVSLPSSISFPQHITKKTIKTPSDVHLYAQKPNQNRFDQTLNVEDDCICCGGGNCCDDRVRVGGGFSDSNITNAYYKKMIEADPMNGLVLGNYARFLKEVLGDVVKAEEYCERAILVNPNDGKVVCLYAELIWEIHGDATRAQLYFDQAVKVEPNDSFVMASYARFLWDSEDE
ncbi:hypothetical protein ACHQM5_029069 [Ranunculus cassubicifolius]